MRENRDRWGRPARRRTARRPERGRGRHVAGVPQRERVRPACRGHRDRRSARRAPLGPGAHGTGPDRVLVAAGRAARARRPGGLPEAGRGPDRRPARSRGRHDRAVRRDEGLPFREGDRAAGVPVHDAAAGGLRDTAAGGGPAAHRGRSASAALPLPQRCAPHRRAHRHGPAAQPGGDLPRPARQLPRRRRHDHRAGSAGRDDGVARRAEPARREGGRLAQPARRASWPTRTGAGR